MQDLIVIFGSVVTGFIAVILATYIVCVYRLKSNVNKVHFFLSFVAFFGICLASQILSDLFSKLFNG